MAASSSDTPLTRFRKEDSKSIDLVLRQIRCLVADLCQQFNGGHPGSAMGMAAIGIALWKYTMTYNPQNPTFFNRDRFVLSNGHTCLFQYIFLHLTGYSHMTLDQLKSYHSSQTDSYCPGHPEIEHPGIEVTTGPLGQGIANAVGLAMASKNLAATYNKPGGSSSSSSSSSYEGLVDNTTYCMIGDACLQEGVGLEAIQLAGHWKLDNLVVIYDNNQITCDGSVDMCNTEDVNAKMTACGWHVVDIEDGCFDVEGLVAALADAKAEKRGKPTFLNVKTVIGIGSQVAGDAKAHGAAYGAEDVKAIKLRFGMDPEEHFVLSEEAYGFFGDARQRGQKAEEEWGKLVESYRKEFPEEGEEFVKRVEGKMTVEDWQSLIPEKGQFPTGPMATRKSAGVVFQPIAAKMRNVMVGTADLSPSVNMIWKDKVDFQHPDLKTSCGINGDYSGRYIHWGVREHAMASISNGLAAYGKGTILPVTSTFFMFYLYAAPGIRMAALQHLQQIHIATHDSIGTGEDGPTHQPIALAALYRAMPNLLYFRPCDTEEVAGCFLVALSRTSTPSLLSLSRQELQQWPEYSDREGVAKGGYVFVGEEGDVDVTLIGVGSEMGFVVKAREILKEKFGLKVRIVSMPCQRVFEEQSKEYKKKVLGKALRVVVEAYAVNGWERYADAGFSMASFGKSLPGKDAYRFFGFQEGVIADRVKGLVDEVKGMEDGVAGLRGDFRELNEFGRVGGGY